VRMPGPQGGAAVSGGGAFLVPADWTPVYRNVPGGPHNDAITRSIDSTSKSATQTVEGFRIIGTQEARLRATASMTCNERVETGNPDAMKRIAALVFQP
jgi:hypothetical protein